VDFPLAFDAEFTDEEAVAPTLEEVLLVDETPVFGGG
jgi:hypothetical protein